MNLRKGRRIIRGLVWLLFVVYILTLSYFLFFSEYYGRTGTSEGYRYNLEFFKEIRRFIVYREQIGFKAFFVNIFGNIFAFSPFGFVLPIISIKNRKFLNVLLLTFELTLTIEILQLLLHVGIFDVDDMILNTIGGVIGYISFAVCYSIYKMIRR